MIEPNSPGGFLANPEAAWERLAALTEVAADEIAGRIGPFVGPIEVLSGGQANVSVRLGADRVLRIYRRDPQSLAKEMALLSHAWQSFHVPGLLASGPDFLVMAYVEHTALSDTAACGATVGRALAEIHRTTFPTAGFLGADLQVCTPFPDVTAALFGYAQDSVDRMTLEHQAGIGASLLTCLQRHAERLRDAAPSPVLLHGDFKVGNVHRTPTGEPLVLDWEFAYAGPPLMDVGQILRWSPSATWVTAFADAYREAGGHLPHDWRHLADVADLVNLAGLLAKAATGSRRERDLLLRILATLA